MWGLLQKITKNLVVFIPLSLLLGFICGLYFDLSFLKSFVLFFYFFDDLPDDGRSKL